MARSRAAGNPSKTVRLMADRDDALWRAAIAERKCEILRRRLLNMDPQKRPEYLPGDRLAILQLMWLLGSSVVRTAKEFVLHRNTVSSWLRRFRGEADPGTFLGKPPWNKIGDSVRWLVHEMRSLGMDLGVGTRAIAVAIRRVGARVSRSSVQRFLREKKPKRPARAKRSRKTRTSRTPRHVLRPKKVNRTWHLDLTVLPLFGMRFHISALLDGFLRKLLALKVHARTPTAVMMSALVKRTIWAVGAMPRFIVTDHGAQFRERFGKLVSRPKTRVVRCAVHCFKLNGKVERLFRTFKAWARLKLFAWFADRRAVARSMQRRADLFRGWFNEQRSHQALSGRTPEQTWTGKRRRRMRAVRAHEPQPHIEVLRRHYRGDRHLPVIDIRVEWPKAG
jgi:transposase